MQEGIKQIRKAMMSGHLATVPIAAASLLAEMPEKQLTTYSRGISGNKVFQLASRWQKDCLDLKPDVLSILIGGNDSWAELREAQRQALAVARCIRVLK